ncbi:MAG TPA: prepilin-type N-terminal cleavage/methylation domain-containing protein [Gemmatimonadales bacterium]|nr:prepilin-type N-terminal cleavage/methylation domain-containing protein [Gemmatimonadales bacterium]
MRNLRLGFTLLEVLLALLLITMGLLGLAGTLGPIAKLSGEGRAKGRIALVLESRLDLLRAELLRTAPACNPPTAGSLQHPDGIVESWSAAAPAGLIELRITAGIAGSQDTLVTRLPCP